MTCTSNLRVLNAREYAELLRVNPQTVRALLRNGHLPHYQFVRSRRIPNPIFDDRPLPEVMTLQEFAVEFRLSPPTVRKGIDLGDIRAMRIGGAIRIWPPPDLPPHGCGTGSPTKNRQSHTSEALHEQSN